MTKKPRFDLGQSRRIKGWLKDNRIIRKVKVKPKRNKKLWRD